MRFSSGLDAEHASAKYDAASAKSTPSGLIPQGLTTALPGCALGGGAGACVGTRAGGGLLALRVALRSLVYNPFGLRTVGVDGAAAALTSSRSGVSCLGLVVCSSC